MEEGNRKAKTVQINHDGIINAVEFCPHSKAVDLLAYTIGPRLTLAKLEGSKKLQDIQQYHLGVEIVSITWSPTSSCFNEANTIIKLALSGTDNNVYLLENELNIADRNNIELVNQDFYFQESCFSHVDWEKLK
eukprot:m.37079 g.37079  ORF g.37079 m.37079 type:complete len:134 (-) comp9239_c0_seq4:851-1252(-)